MRGETDIAATSRRNGGIFQSTLPMRGETHEIDACVAKINISIHSPHAGRDAIIVYRIDELEKFQSTLPMRGETMLLNLVMSFRKFQSTLPMRGETKRTDSDL